MNTDTNAAHPKEKLDRAVCRNLLLKLAIIRIILVLVATVAITTYSASQPVAGVNNPSVPYSNALERNWFIGLFSLSMTGSVWSGHG